MQSDESTLTDAQDFRRRAFEESKQILGSTIFDHEIADHAQASLGYSLCVPTNLDSTTVHRKLKRMIGIHAALGILGIAVGGVIAFWRKHANDDASDTFWLIPAGIASLSGFVFLLRGSFQERKLLRSIVQGRLCSPFDWREAKPIYVHIEDATTVGRLKLLSEDVGILFLKPEMQRLHIQGISGRYLFVDEDVESLKSFRMGKSKAVMVEVKVGETILALSLKDQGMLSELQAQLFHRNALLQKIERTLGRS